MHIGPKINKNNLLFGYDSGNHRYYPGEPTTNIWGIVNGGSVNSRSGWDKPYAYNGAITETVYTGGTWNGNRVWEVLHTLGTSGYGGYESWRLCVDQPTASPNTYSSTRRVAMKICVLEGNINDMGLHSGGGNGGHNSGAWTAIPSSEVPRDCQQKTGWYQFLDDGSWGSTSVGHCVGLGFITYSRVRILITEPMYYPSNKLLPFTPYQRTSSQGLVDKTKTRTVNLTNNSFTSSGSISFNGTNNYIEVPSFNITTNEFTLEAVIRPTSTGGSNCIIKKNTSNDNWPIFSMYVIGSDLYGYYSSPIYGQSLEGAFTTNDPITNNNWYHVVYSKGTGGYTTMKLFINGVSVGYSNFLYGSHINEIANSTKPMHIGRDLDGSNWVAPFNGEIPIVRVYNRQLSNSEIMENFKGYQRRFSIP
jgi:hypothetical protein